MHLYLLTFSTLTSNIKVSVKKNHSVEIGKGKINVNSDDRKGNKKWFIRFFMANSYNFHDYYWPHRIHVH